VRLLFASRSGAFELAEVWPEFPLELRPVDALSAALLAPNGSPHRLSLAAELRELREPWRLISFVGFSSANASCLPLACRSLGTGSSRLAAST